MPLMWQGQHQTQPRGPRPLHPSQQAQQAPQPQPQTAYVQPYPAQDNSSASYYPNRRRWCLRLNKLKLQPSSGPRSRAPFAARPISDLYSNTTSTTDTPQTQSVLQQQHQTQAQMSHSPVETHASVQSQTQVQKQQTLTGPPFVIDSTATYQDQNAQAWTQYYAQGGDRSGWYGALHLRSWHQRTRALRPLRWYNWRQKDNVNNNSKSHRPRLSRQAPRALYLVISLQCNDMSGYTGPRAPELVANSYGQSSSSTNGEAVSAETGGPDMGACAPWETTAATTTLPGQFEQTRVAWASPCRRLIMGVRRSR